MLLISPHQSGAALDQQLLRRDHEIGLADPPAARRVERLRRRHVFVSPAGAPVSAHLATVATSTSLSEMSSL
jgi:hypothetical protein